MNTVRKAQEFLLRPIKNFIINTVAEALTRRETRLRQSVRFVLPDSEYTCRFR